MELIFLYGGSLFVFVFFGVYVTKWVYLWLEGNQLISLNFEGNRVVHSFGMNICLHYFLFVFIHYLLEVIFKIAPLGTYATFLFIVLIFVLSLMGWLDDHFGDEQVKGFRGHFRAFIKERKITTGLAKAIIGGALSFYISLSLATQLYEAFFYWAILVCSIHFFNLLDARPGRAIKSFWLLSIFLIFFLSSTFLYQYYVPVIISTLLLFSYDRRRLAMLGDTGSNTLGGIFGFFILSVNQPLVQLLFLILFLTLGLLAEKYSLSELINKSLLLTKWDRWGIK